MADAPLVVNGLAEPFNEGKAAHPPSRRWQVTKYKYFYCTEVLFPAITDVDTAFFVCFTAYI